MFCVCEYLCVFYQLKWGCVGCGIEARDGYDALYIEIVMFRQYMSAAMQVID